MKQLHPRQGGANVSQFATLDREALTERVGTLPDKKLVLPGTDIALGR